LDLAFGIIFTIMGFYTISLLKRKKKWVLLSTLNLAIMVVVLVSTGISLLIPFWKVFTKQKHICKNRNNNNASYSKTNVLKPNYYNRFVVVCGNNFLISLCILRKCNPFSVILNVLVPSRYFIRLVSVNVERYSFYWL